MKNFIIVNVENLKNNSSKIIIQNNIPIAIYKLNNNFFVLDNRCPHRGASLGDGKLNDSIIECPLHNWKFNIETGECILNSKIQIKSYKFEILDDKIKIMI